MFSSGAQGSGRAAGSAVSRETDAKIDFEAEAQGLAEAPLRPRLARGSSRRYIPSQLKSQDANKRWWDTCDPGLPLTVQGLARTSTSPLNPGSWWQVGQE